MKKKFTLLIAAFALLITVFQPGRAWGQTTETVTLSNGSYETDHITWTCASNNITIQQLKGSSGTAVNSSYISAPRIYKGHVLSFVCSNNYTITSISIKYTGSYSGNSMTAGTVMLGNTVTDNPTDVARTWATANNGTHVVSSVSADGLSAIYIQNVASTNVQLRPTEITVTYLIPSTTDPTVSADNVDIAYDATSGAIDYTINNGVSGGVLTAATTSEWLTIGTVGTTVPFTCTANEGLASRSASVTLTYTYNTNQTAHKTVIVTQAGNPNASGGANNPYTVAQARAAIDANSGTQGVYATGIVSEIVTPWGQNNYQNITFNIVDNSGDTDFLQAYRCVGTEAPDVLVGDIVVVSGNLTKYSSTYEFAQGCEVVSLTHTVTTHELTFGADPTAGGTVTVGTHTSPATIAEGNTVDITATPNTGYVFGGWTVTGAGSSVADATSATTTFTMGTADATLTANFTQVVTYTVTYYPNVTGTAPIEHSYNAGEDVTVANNTFSNPGHAFSEWNTDPAGGGDPYSPGDVIQNIGANYNLYAQWVVSSNATDVLNWAATGSPSSYTDWTYTAPSGTGYAGQSSGNYQSIQLRSSNDNSGIVTTTSVGNATKVVVTWNSNTVADRTLNIYGKNTAYTDATDLYGTNAGELLGTIVCGTGTEFNISGGYAYIGMRSASGALYLDEIDITWNTSGVVPPSITANNVNIAYDATSSSIAYTINNEPDPAGTLTASTTDTWLTLGTPTSGLVPFTCSANDATTVRTATITLTYTYNSTETVNKDVTVTQAAAPVIYSTIPALFAAATSSETEVLVSFNNWVVSGVSTNGKNAYVTDNNGNGFVIYDNNAGLGTTYPVGSILTSASAVTCKLKLNNGYARLNNVDATALTIGTGGTVVQSNIDMASLSGVNTGALVHYENLTCSTNSSNYYLTDGTTTIQVYGSLYNFGTALEAGKTYNITGIYQQYNTTSNTTKEVLPRSAADIEEVVVSTPAITLDTYEINATATGASGMLIATYSMIEISAGLEIEWYESDGVTPATYNWVIADFDTDNNVEYIIDANDGAARSAYFKVYGLDAGTNDVYSNLVTINQDAYAVATYTVTYAANGGTGTMTDPNSPYLAGVEVTLLANAFTAPEGMKWDSWEVKDADNQDVTVNGGKFTMPASNVTVTAQWVVDPDAPQYEWVLTDIANLTSSDVFVIVGTRNNTTYYGMSNDNGTSTQPSAVEVTIANNKLSAVPAANIKWNISGDNTDGYIFYPNGDADAWLYCNTTAGSSSNTNMRVGTGDRKLFVLDDNNYLVTNDSYTDRYVSLNGSTDWRGYVNTNQATTITFFKRQIASTDPVLYTDDVDIASDATAGEITYTLEHPVSGGVLTAAITAGNEGNWLTLGTVGTTIPFTCSANTVATARTATITLTYTYNTNVTVTATAIVTQAHFVADYATLPFAFDAGRADIENVVGLTQEGLDSDYGSSPKLKFNTTGDWVILKLNEAPTSLSYTLKGNSTSNDGGTFSVQTSADGVDYVDLAEYVTTTLNNKTFTYTHIDLNANVRYIKWIYTNKSNGNVALGDIHATANYDIYGTVTVASLSVPATKTCTIYEGGQLIHDTGTIPVTMVKHVKGYTSEKDNYYLITVPFNDVVDPTTVTGMTTGNFDLYEFHAWEPGQEWANFEAQNSFDFLQPGVGYLYAKDTDIDLEFTGTINPSTDYEYYMGFNNDPTAPFDGWEIVGNPFACNTYITGASTTGEGMAFYRMNTDGNGFTAATGAIKPLEGVFVQATADNQSFTFTRTAPVTSFGHGNLNLSLAQVVTNRGEQPDTDNAIIRFDGGSTLEKYSFRENTAKLYITQNGKDYSVVNSEAQGEMPVNFKAANDGTYTLDFSMDNVEFDYLHLIDNKTGMDIDLLQTPSYTFEATTHDYAARFRLVFSANSVNENSSESFAFISNGQLILTNVDNNTTVQMIDALGRMIVSTNAMNHVSTDNMAPGVYVLRLVNGNDVKTQKIVVK